MTTNSSSADTTTSPPPVKPEQRPRLKAVLIALLLLTFFCLSFYLSWIPGPAERRLVGCWTTTMPGQPQTGGDHHTFIQLTQDRVWTTWWWNEDGPDWQIGSTGRWSLDGDTIELHYENGDRGFGRLLERMFNGDSQEQFILLEAGPDRLVTRFPPMTEALEWTRVSEDSIPQVRNSPNASQ